MPSRPSRLAAFFLLLAVAFLAGSAVAAPPVRSADAVLESEHWYVMEITGAPAGWTRAATYLGPKGYRTETRTELRIRRGATEIEILSEEIVLESVKGAPIELYTWQKLARSPIETHYAFNGDTVTVTTKASGADKVQTLPAPKTAWLTPVAARRFFLERVEAKAKTIEYRTLSGEQGTTPVEIRHRFEGRAPVTVGDRTIDATVWKTETSAMPGVKATEHYSSDGRLLRQVANAGFGTMTLRLSTKKEAEALGAKPAPELMVALFTPVDRPIQRARATRNSVLRVKLRGDGTMPELPSAGAQRVELDPEKPGEVLLHIDIDAPLAASAAEQADETYLQASTMADHADPVVTKLAQRARRNASGDPASRAEAMRSFVHGFISSKALDTAFATATEIARMRRGDCSEHGVLLCAMLRADGIPARVATGLVYADQFAGERDIFGWHMWTQALIDGVWVDLDATLPRAYDAAHILTGTSSLADGGSVGELNSAIMLMGNLDVEVVEVGYRALAPTP